MATREPPDHPDPVSEPIRLPKHGRGITNLGPNPAGFPDVDSSNGSSATSPTTHSRWGSFGLVWLRRTPFSPIAEKQGFARLEITNLLLVFSSLYQQPDRIEVVSMIVSQRRIEANRRNSQLSSGPKTEEGKLKSRANALKHGLCASVVVAEDMALVQQRSIEFFETFKPQNEVHVWMIDQAALCSIKIERSQRIERRVRDKIALRAELMWDHDRRFEVEVTARSLAKDPAATVEALRGTLHGCEWLIARWALLAHAADIQPEGWTDDQKRLAFDLLATPHGFRDGRQPCVEIDDEGRVIEGAGDPAGFARRQIAGLKEERDIASNVDEVERALAMTDLTNEGSPELRRLRRYESKLHSTLRWSLKQAEIQSPYRCADPSLRPHWVADPEPELKPEPKTADELAFENWNPTELQPPFDLEPDEIPPDGQNPDIPAIAAQRRDKKFRKDEARRQSRRQKVEKLRA